MIFTGIGKIWDDKKQSTLCEFSPSGILNTEDPYIIKRMHELGYVEASEDESHYQYLQCSECGLEREI